ncbi:gluconate 2-dehydrogenase subunit 3 family protein [Pelagibacterium montanilacus]|uniref:gluconate 2-dehydrogenase subunit 3 family protein n=1 Tax=Pelagibacterium montanilacus TaxID=2185280 RepID=UPI000F8EBD3D|nr:gluconate 2-dehydrogenase subunit 3 family protein [Pelagibacterium montanilacus]
MVRISRRAFIRQILMAGTVVAGFPAAALGRQYRGGEGMPWEAGQTHTPYYGTEPGTFFTSAERACVDAITARLIPSDEDGPGAREAGVVEFIDRQMAGFFGRGQRWYMSGPWPEGLPTQGYQSQFTPAQLYREAIAALDAWCETNRGGSFAALEEDAQDEILTGIESGDVTFDGVSAETFFSLVKENAIEGFFCDPIYGGNRDMVGWSYVGFPGARYDYRDFVHHDGARIDLPPVALMGRPEWSAAQ